MISMDHILPLTDFKRNTTEVREQLKASGQPAVLTVDGRPELVVQDAAAYPKLLERVERIELEEGIRRGMESLAKGEGRSLEEFDAYMRAKYKIPGPKA